MAKTGGQFNGNTGRVESGRYAKGHSIEDYARTKDRFALVKDALARRKR
ncbi:MAG: hypothetical protein QOH97_2718 [Actinoplanes sp.]|jgi:hypothetical protein|nr:hypothetical protein [Actinoplanes sp.]